MGAGYAGKNPDKAIHATNVLSAVNEYKLSLPEHEREATDSTLFEFKDKVQKAAKLSARNGKDIAKSLSKLSDVDLETMRQYVNKKEFIPQAVESNVNDDKLDEDDTSILSYDEDLDQLEEALDTFDVAEQSSNKADLVDQLLDISSGNVADPQGSPANSQVSNLSLSLHPSLYLFFYQNKTKLLTYPNTSYKIIISHHMIASVTALPVASTTTGRFRRI